MQGYQAKLLRINLSTRTVVAEDIAPERTRHFLGGDGLAASYVWDEINASVDPLGPENKLIIVAGTLAGTGMLSCNRFEVAAKSPTTGIYGDACAGGFWGPTLRMTGHDVLIIEGKASVPTYLLISETGCTLRDATHLWGLDTVSTVAQIRKELNGPRARVLLIGPAGENQVKIAAVVDDEGHAAARSGMAAVMGSKGLKAIVVKGSQRPAVADKELLKAVQSRIREQMAESPGIEVMSKFGTAGDVENAEFLGDMPIKNWAVGSWREGAAALSGQRMAELYLTRSRSCHSCPVHCKRVVEVKGGPYASPEGHGPEYETLGSLGTLLMNDNLEAVIKMNDLCTRYGLDTISCGSVIAFAIECRENGLLTSKDLGPLRLQWGDAPGHIEVIEAMAFRHGLGELLGEGTKAAAEKLGGKAGEFAIHTKGLELPMHDPRAKDAMGLSYATANRGGCHLQANAHQVEGGVLFPELGINERLDRLSSAGKAPVVAKTQHLSSVLDAIGMCRIPVACGAITVTDIVDGLRAYLGQEVMVTEIDEVGERIFNLKRAFNVLCGIGRKDDTLPKRVLTLALDGGSQRHLPDLKEQLEEYYRVRGWSSDGVPGHETLMRLGLQDAAKRLKERRGQGGEWRGQSSNQASR